MTSFGNCAIRITLMTMFKVNPTLICNDAEHGPTVTRDYWLFILRMASWLVLCALKVRLLPSKVDNYNEVGSQLPHRAHISRASCWKKPAERNDVLVF